MITALTRPKIAIYAIVVRDPENRWDLFLDLVSIELFIDHTFAFGCEFASRVVEFYYTHEIFRRLVAERDRLSMELAAAQVKLTELEWLQKLPVSPIPSPEDR